MVATNEQGEPVYMNKPNECTMFWTVHPLKDSDGLFSLFNSFTVDATNQHGSIPIREALTKEEVENVLSDLGAPNECITWSERTIEHSDPNMQAALSQRMLNAA